MDRRAVDLAVVSDVHLGTAACQAEALHAYLRSIAPRRLVLAGDIVDLWHLRSGAWTPAQTRVVRRVLKLASHGCEVTWLAGNHDGALRRFIPFTAAGIAVHDELLLDLDGVRTWFVHGDLADALIATPRWLALIGWHGYDVVQWLGDRLDGARRLVGLPRRSLAAAIKARIPAALRHAERFAGVMARLAAERGAGAVVCGHIHVPADRVIADRHPPVRYLNSGDWVDSLSALEWDAGRWRSVRWDQAAAIAA